MAEPSQRLDTLEGFASSEVARWAVKAIKDLLAQSLGGSFASPDRRADPARWDGLASAWTAPATLAPSVLFDCLVRGSGSASLNRRRPARRRRRLKLPG